MTPDRIEQTVMFMSCDVSGATAFKVGSDRKNDCGAWIAAFEALFRELPLVFIGEVARAFIGDDEVPEVGVWKVMGDEVIFIAMPGNVREAELLAVAFHRTVICYDRQLAARWPLRIRGCCWAAEIGSRNRRIEIPEMFGGQDGQPYVDFLGQDVDTGFRLSACCGGGDVVVSPNLVEALSCHGSTAMLRFDWVDNRVLKGVVGGQPFPVILLSTDSGGEEQPDTDTDSIGANRLLGQSLAELRERMRNELGIEMAPAVFGRARTRASVG